MSAPAAGGRQRLTYLSRASRAAGAPMRSCRVTGCQVWVPVPAPLAGDGIKGDPSGSLLVGAGRSLQSSFDAVQTSPRSLTLALAWPCVPGGGVEDAPVRLHHLRKQRSDGMSR